MGFLGNPIKKIGGALSKLPGAKTLNKPINKALGQTPGLKKLPQQLGMAGPAKKSPIAPSPSVPANAMAQGKMGEQAGPPPMAQLSMGMGPKPLEMQGPQPMPGPIEMPEAQPGMQEMASLAAPQPQPSLGPWNPDPNSVPQELRQAPAQWGGGTPQIQPQMQPQVAQQPNPQMGGMMNAGGNLAQALQRNSGVTGGMKAKQRGIGPRFMG